MTSRKIFVKKTIETRLYFYAPGSKNARTRAITPKMPNSVSVCEGRNAVGYSMRYSKANLLRGAPIGAGGEHRGSGGRLVGAGGDVRRGMFDENVLLLLIVLLGGQLLRLLLHVLQVPCLMQQR